MAAVTASQFPTPPSESERGAGPHLEIEVSPERRVARTCCYSLFRDSRELSRREVIRLIAPLPLTAPVASGLSCLSALILGQDPKMGAIFGAVFGSTSQLCPILLNLCEPPPTATEARQRTHEVIDFFAMTAVSLIVSAVAAQAVVKMLGYELSDPEAFQLGWVTVGLGTGTVAVLAISCVALVVFLAAADRAVARCRARPEAV